MSFPLTPLAQITEKIGSGSTPRGGDSVYVSSGAALIRSQNVYNSEFTETGLVYIDDETAVRMKGVAVFEDDVLLNITGDSVARCCKVKGDILPARVNQHVAIIRANKEYLDPDFLMYYLTSPYMQAKLLSWAGTGGTRKALTKVMIENFEVPTPDLDIQKNISSILKTYSDLIENNRRRIQLLEESARLLYKEWFVQLRFPGHEHVKIIDGVPEGWGHTSVGSILGKVKRKGKVKSEDYLADGLLACVDQSKDFIGGYIDDLELAIKEDLPVVVFGDHTRVVKYVDFPFTPGADGTQILIPNSDEMPRVFFYFLIAGINLANAFYARHFKFLKATQVLIPTKELMRLFEDSVSSNMEQISLLREQNNKLAQARDILLPRLMNGELAV